MVITSIIFIGIAASTGIAGISLGAKGTYNSIKANEINNISNAKVRKISSELNYNRLLCGKSIEDFAELKLQVLNEDVTRFINTFEKIKNVDLKESKGINELTKLKIDKKTFEELKDMQKIAVTLTNGIAKGGLGGALVAYGAYGAASKLALASTGTAISTLHGVAASNATLAFFGGGSLASGGLGIAGGTMVLGGLVAGPALLVMGIIVGNKSGKKLEEAIANEEKAKVAYEEISINSNKCIAIYSRVNMFFALLDKLSNMAKPLIEEMEKVVLNSGTDYKKYIEKDKKVIKKNVVLICTIKAILDTSILSEDGSLTTESEKLIDDLKDYNI